VLKTNVEKLIKMSVMGEIASPTIRSVYSVSATGKALVLPGVGGITYNLRVGDLACGWEADHVEPGVSAENKENDARSGQGANTAFNVLSCVGNKATVLNGDSKGAEGTITGKHGGIEHVLVDFPRDVLPAPGGPTRHIMEPLASFLSFLTARNSSILFFTSSRP
jgi:hypothetical protein